MAEPITLEQAKLQCALLDDDSRDELLEIYIEAARVWVENYTGHILVQREFTEQRDCFGRYLELQRRPVLADPAPTIGYVDTAGTTQTYAGAVPSVDRFPARIYPALNGWWPSVGRNGSVTITYVAGYEPGEEPRPLLQAILLLVATWFEQRSSVVIGQPASEIPFAVISLCDQYRTPSL
jgi:uncharacterized phiE125 gp8 family phage protein